MDARTFNKLKEFADPYYAEKDEMHGLAHIQRLLSGARNLGEGNEPDDDLLIFGAYLHGFTYSGEPGIRKFLASLGFKEDRVGQIVRVAQESLDESHPETKEGIYLHDAHLIEGGKTFGIVKALATGAARGQKLLETLDFIENKLLGKHRCVTAKAQAIYQEKERFTREFVAELRKHL